MVRIAVFKMASRKVIDESEKGILDALQQRGYIDGKNCIIQRYCPEGDAPVANTIAHNIVSSKFDLVITVSTPALQVMANANKDGKVMHVFSTVTDPYVSGVGISGPGPSQHPKHLVGIGTFQPVEDAFEVAKKMKPDIKKVGTVWCTSETCSEACVKLARKKCRELGIELKEVSVENTTQIFEAATALTMQGVEAIWLGGDNVVETGVDQLIKAVTSAKIPLFSNNPYSLYGNALFGLGADYYEVGKTAGNIAADVLDGKSTSAMSVTNVVPKYLNINRKALNNLKDHWDVSSFK